MPTGGTASVILARDDALTDRDLTAVTELDVPASAGLRKRPIRTYGKRAAQSREPEAPPLKKKRTDTSKETDATQIQSSPQVLVSPKSEPPKRGSILSYFKLMPSSSRVPPVLSDQVEPTLTPPPSSPVPSYRAGKRRRLTTRPSIVEDAGSTIKIRHQRNPGDNSEGEPQQVQGLEEDGVRQPHRDPDNQRGVLQEVSPHTLNEMVHAEKSSDQACGEKKKKKLKRRSTKDMVQTTLSLSIDPRPGFTICKECEILYNHLNENDRQEHKKQHAAYMRKKLKRRG